MKITRIQDHINSVILTEKNTQRLGGNRLEVVDSDRKIKVFSRFVLSYAFQTFYYKLLFILWSEKVYYKLVHFIVGKC